MCAWGATSRLGSWWRSNRPTWMTAQRRSCCSSWCAAVLNGWFTLFHETFPFHNCHIWFVSLNPEWSSAFQTVPPPEPADLSPGFQLLLPALGPHPLDGLWSANSITLLQLAYINLGNLLELNVVRLITSFPPLLFLKGSADSLLRTYFPDGMSESLIAYLLYGVLKALEYLHRMGYVHRSVRKTKTINPIMHSASVNICLPVPHWLQGGEGQPHSAVGRGARLPLGAPQCLQYDAWGEEDEGGVWYAPPQPCSVALAQPWTAATGQESLDKQLVVWSQMDWFFFLL